MKDQTIAFVGLNTTVDQVGEIIMTDQQRASGGPVTAGRPMAERHPDTEITITAGVDNVIVLPPQES